MATCAAGCAIAIIQEWRTPSVTSTTLKLMAAASQSRRPSPRPKFHQRREAGTATGLQLGTQTGKTRSTLVGVLSKHEQLLYWHVIVTRAIPLLLGVTSFWSGWTPTFLFLRISLRMARACWTGSYRTAARPSTQRTTGPCPTAWPCT